MSNFIPLARVISVEIYFFIRLNLKNSHLRLTEICMDLRFRRKKLIFDTLGLGLDLKLEALDQQLLYLFPFLLNHCSPQHLVWLHVVDGRSMLSLSGCSCFIVYSLCRYTNSKVSVFSLF